jgi:hypothetical protein
MLPGKNRFPGLAQNPELQETKDRVQSINDIYTKQMRTGVEITDITMLNTDNGAMGQCMDMFLDHKVQENALGKLTAVDKKKKRRQAGLAKKAGGARISAGLMAITNRYAIGPAFLAWVGHTRLEKERQTKAKERTGRLEQILLKEKVDMVLYKMSNISRRKVEQQPQGHDTVVQAQRR